MLPYGIRKPQVLKTVKNLPDTIARKGEGAAAMWGPDGGDLFEQVRSISISSSRRVAAAAAAAATTALAR